MGLLKKRASVSVVVPCYNNSRTLLRAFNSIINQKLLPAEVIFVDDRSQDSTGIILNKIKNNFKTLVRVIFLDKNLGVSNARNIGWAIATQPYIAFLDADDAWHPQKIALQYNYMKNNPEIVMSGHSHILDCSQKNKLDWNIDRNQVFFISKWKLIFSNQFITPSVMLKKEIEERFDSKQRYMEDHKLWVDIAYKHNRITKLSAPLASIYKPAFGTKGLSGDLWKMEKADLSNLKHFLRSGYINQFEYLFLFLFSLIRFFRRIFIAFFRHAK